MTVPPSARSRRPEPGTGAGEQKPGEQEPENRTGMMTAPVLSPEHKTGAVGLCC